MEGENIYSSTSILYTLPFILTVLARCNIVEQNPPVISVPELNLGPFGRRVASYPAL